MTKGSITPNGGFAIPRMHDKVLPTYTWSYGALEGTAKGMHILEACCHSLEDPSYSSRPLPLRLR
jgi:hypothetical protein